jgi:polyisoprenoid-binding protein YceI
MHLRWRHSIPVLAFVSTCAAAASVLEARAVIAPRDALSALALRVRLVTAPQGNEARYRVREQLLNVELPSDAVGVTSAVTGTLVLEDNGTVVAGESKFVIDLTTLKSDSDRRDNFIRSNTLQTDSFPNAEFVPTAIHGLRMPLPSSGTMALEMVGDLTVHGVKRPTTWAVTARAENGAFAGTATTAFKFGDFGMTIPRVRSVLSVVDSIRLEYDFRLVPEDGTEAPEAR